MGISSLVYVPFGNNTYKSALKNPQPNIIYRYVVGGTSKVEGPNVVIDILSNFTFKLRDVKGKLIFYSGPIGIMMDRIINQLV
jgi:hypothetical protein